MTPGAPIPAGSPGQVPTLQLPSLTLRPITERDLDFVEQASHDVHITQITTVPAAFTPEAGLEFIHRQHGRLAEGHGYPFVLEQTSAEGAVGFIGVWFREYAEHDHLTLGYFLLDVARGRGLMSRALLGLSDWAFATFECDQHRLYIEPWNVASQRTGEHADFVHKPDLDCTEMLGGVEKPVGVWDRSRPSPQPA